MNPSQEVSAILVRKKWRANKLAKKAGVQTSTITRILHGQTSPMWATMEAIRLAAKGR